jgi:tungstate transport system permease protein
MRLIVYLTQYNDTIIAMSSNFSEIVSLTFFVSGTALLISALIGVPLGAWWGFHPFRGRKVTTAFLYTGMGLPPVVVGLFVYMLLSRSGPLGGLNWPLLPRLFTPAAMILAQVIIALPLVAGLTMASVMGVSQAMRWQIQALGADRVQSIKAVLWEARRGVILALVAGFGAIISEVGAVMLVGGNIAGQTRVLTTAIVLETRQGDFTFALQLGIALLVIAFIINFTVVLIQERDGQG